MVTTTEVAVTSTLPERSNRLRKTVLAWEWLYSLPMRWAIMRYSELAMSVSCMSKSTFMPTMEESAYIWGSIAESMGRIGDLRGNSWVNRWGEPSYTRRGLRSL